MGPVSKSPSPISCHRQHLLPTGLQVLSLNEGLYGLAESVTVSQGACLSRGLGTQHRPGKQDAKVSAVDLPPCDSLVARASRFLSLSCPRSTDSQAKKSGLLPQECVPGT